MPTGPTSPKIELITQNLLTTLGGVTVANGYQITIIPERRKQGGNDPRRNYLAVLCQLNCQPLDNPCGGFLRWLQHYLLEVYVLTSEGDSNPVDYYVNRVRSDIEKALMVDVQRSSLAQNTILEGTEPFADNALAFDGVGILFAVDYQTLETSPYLPT